MALLGPCWKWGHRGILFGPSVSLGALANAWGAHAMGQNGGPSRGVANVSVPVGARNLASRRPLGAHLRATEAALGLSWGPGAPAGHPPSGHIENSSDARGHTNSSDSYTAQIPTRALKGWWDFFDSTLWHLYRSDLVQAGVFPRGRWRALLGGLSSGVAHMHSIGLVHADLPLRKPLVGCFDLRNFFFIVRINRPLRLDADNLGFCRRSLSVVPRGMSSPSLRFIHLST